MELSDTVYVNNLGFLIYVDRNHYNYNLYTTYKIVGFTELGWFLFSR